ncbi:MAG: PTS sugar transporter subunit IIC/EAL domain-containing protein [Anaeroplasmataceae bacterium]
MKDKIKNFLLSKKIISIFSCIKSGMLSAMPMFIIGAIGLVIQYLPISAYQSGIQNICNGQIYKFLNIVNTVTLGIISLVLTSTIAYSRSKYYSDNNEGDIYYVIIALLSFVCLTDFNTSEFTINSFNVQGVFIAIVSAIISTTLYHQIISILKRKTKIISLGIDTSFNKAISMLIPFLIVIILFALFRIILYIMGVHSIHESITNVIIKLFSHVKYDYLKGLLYVFFVSILWFFGIHGGDVLEPVIKGNLDSITNGIFSKTFNDVFVIMGGCGSALCLVLAIIIFSKNKRVKKVSYTALPFSIFNISEIVIFGIPIVFNPIFIIPFIFVPIINYSISYLAIYLNIVPNVVSEVIWTCPIFVSGYIATNSIAGILLQLFNIIIGVGIYAIFIKINDKIFKKEYEEDVKYITRVYYESISKGLSPNLLTTDNYNRAQMLATDIYKALNKDELEIYYQPQTKNTGVCYGSEALLRYNHKELGFIDPPIIIELAKEAGFLNKLELFVANKVLEYRSEYNCGLVSFNVTAESFINEDFIDYIIKRSKELKIGIDSIAIEITEDTIMASDEIVRKNISKLKENNINVILDDFGMGHTSLLYLQSYTFSTVKIAGELIKDCETNNNSIQIIKSIVDLGRQLNYETTAEYVESKKCRDLLINLGITNIQGYYYSKPLPSTMNTIYFIENNKIEEKNGNTN